MTGLISIKSLGAVYNRNNRTITVAGNKCEMVFVFGEAGELEVKSESENITDDDRFDLAHKAKIAKELIDAKEL